MNNIFDTTEYACSGCGACAAVCPKNAIEIKLDATGFFKAVLNEDECVSCGLCRRVCTKFEKELTGIELDKAKLRALQSASGETVLKCSSGGIAHELAVSALSQGMIVAGVRYNTSTDRAEHCIIDSAEKLSLFDGSKYIQSDTTCFSVLVESVRRKGDRALVFGTPCQITGLAKLAEQLNIRDNFLLVEIFCHGVPSYKLWDEECAGIRCKLQTDTFDSVNFRYKKDDWHSYCLKVEANGKTFFGARETEVFWQVFFENILLGDSCFNCRMRKTVSKADLRIGDYWGRKFSSRSDGVSAVFSLTERGERAVSELLDSGVVIELEADSIDGMLSAQNMSGYHDLQLHERAMTVLRDTGNINQAIKAYRAGQSGKQKLKRILLVLSSVIPDGLRAKLRKVNSNRNLIKEIKCRN